MQLIYGRKAISGPRTIRTLDPIIQTRRSYMHVRVRGRPWRKKRGKEGKKSILYRRPLVFIPVHFACLYVSKFDIDSVCSPSCGGGERKKKNVISRMNNLTSILFFRPVPPSYRIRPRWKFREARVNFHWLATVLKKRRKGRTNIIPCLSSRNWPRK